jgi:hypothetical protein
MSKLRDYGYSTLMFFIITIGIGFLIGMWSHLFYWVFTGNVNWSVTMRGTIVGGLLGCWMFVSLLLEKDL